MNELQDAVDLMRAALDIVDAAGIEGQPGKAGRTYLAAAIDTLARLVPGDASDDEGGEAGVSTGPITPQS